MNLQRNAITTCCFTPLPPKAREFTYRAKAWLKGSLPPET